MKARIVRGIAQTLCACLLALVSDGCSPSQQPGQPLSVDAVIESPEQFTDDLVVAGRVSTVDSGSGAFALGCEDACVVLPVKFTGHLPAVGRDVVVRGQIKKNEQGRYLFDAQTVETQ